MTLEHRNEDSSETIECCNAGSLPPASETVPVTDRPGACVHNTEECSVLVVDGQRSDKRERALPCFGQPAMAPTNKCDVFIKPQNDDMHYRYVLLYNGLRALLISDPTTDKAGAAMDVRVGSMSDPDHLPGLAHFLEHMLFFSSEKYPKEDEYTKFISDRGGSTNAYTASEHTNYHFDINWESLAPALDRFAQFFIAPTISRDGIEREVRAVDSEHVKNLQSDAWRNAEVAKATANPRHPWARFSTGNRETLYTMPLAIGTDPRDEVLDFYTRHYSADRCSLAVLGRHSLDEMEEMVRSTFGAVPQKQAPRPSFGDDVYLPEHLGVLIKIAPIREGQSLELVWQVPPSEHLYREQSLGYLSHLLGHEGDGSVFALLKAVGWASALWAGESASMSFASVFTIHIDLTEEGQRNIRDVAAVVFRYLELLRREGGICERIWEEVRGLAQLQFDTRDRSKPVTYCTTLSKGLHLYPPQDLLPAVYGVPREFSPSAIREALALMTAQRVRAIWVSKQHLNVASPAAPKAVNAPETAVGSNENDNLRAFVEASDSNGGDCGGGGDGDVASMATELLTEPVYGTRYGISPLPADWLAVWVSAKPEDEPKLHLPTPNRFIPTDLSLADDEAAAAGPHPEVVAGIPGRLRLWHKPDTRFRQPKAVLNLDVQSPEAYSSPRAAVMTRIFTKLMMDALNEVAYPAQQAGLDYNLVNTQSGWQLLLSGYNHKLPELLSEVLDRLANFQVLPDRFEFVRESLVQEYANQLHNQPYSWAMYRAEMLTTARRWPIEVYGSQAASVTADELQGFVKRLCSRCFVEGIAAGNLRLREVLRCGALLVGCLRDRCGAAHLHPVELADLRVIEVPPTPSPHPVHRPPLSPSAPPTPVAPQPVPDPAGCSSLKQQQTEGEGACLQLQGTDGAGDGRVAEVAEGGGGFGIGLSVVTEADGEETGFQPVSGGWLFAEDVPNGQDENSAALVTYQVGPDTPRRNALRSLLVHLVKRDAFSELRTRQQLGYIVSLHGNSEHGVGYVEAVVQSNSYDAEELCRRLDDFMQWFLEIGLPAKCGLGTLTAEIDSREHSTTTTAAKTATVAEAPRAAETGPEAPAQAPGGVEAVGAPEAEVNPDVEVGEEATVSVISVTTPRQPPALAPAEFHVAVEELSKSKLEKPKRLGELANRWWAEVNIGTYLFNRQEAEVAELQSLTTGELLDFAWEVLAGRPRPSTISPTSTTTTGATTATSVTTTVEAGGGRGGATALLPPTQQQPPYHQPAALPVGHCRRITVQLRGKAELTRAAINQHSQPQLEAVAAKAEVAAEAADVGGEDVEVSVAAMSMTMGLRRRLQYHLIPAMDPFSWKHSCAVLPSVRALWAARRAAAGTAPVVSSIAEEEVERIWHQEAQ